MIRDLGPYVPRRPHKLNGPIMAMLLNAVHDLHKGRVFVVQVGAGSGETAPPLLARFRDHGWSGLMIEPLPRNFAQLEAQHRDSERVAILNLGIAERSATLALHALTLEAEGANRRVPQGRASLTRDRLLGPGIAETDLETVDVPVLRMDTVLGELGIDSAQLVVINAGGHEAEVLRSFDLGALAPALALVNVAAASPAETACLPLLAASGYLSFRVGGWLAALAPGRLSVPLEDLLTFFDRAAGTRQDNDASQDDDE